MKKLCIIILMLISAGCSLIPSKFDSNEAKIMTDIQLTIREFDCSNPVNQINELHKEVYWLQIYSSFRGSRDILSIIDGLSNTVTEFKARINNGPISPMYCDLKKKILIQQADISAKAVHGRF